MSLHSFKWIFIIGINICNLLLFIISLLKTNNLNDLQSREY